MDSHTQAKKLGEPAFHIIRGVVQLKGYCPAQYSVSFLNVAQSGGAGSPLNSSSLRNCSFNIPSSDLICLCAANSSSSVSMPLAGCSRLTCSFSALSVFRSAPVTEPLSEMLSYEGILQLVGCIEETMPVVSEGALLPRERVTNRYIVTLIWIYRYTPYSLVKSIIAFRFSGFTSSTEVRGERI
jgi:hypothetical protein